MKYNYLITVVYKNGDIEYSNQTGENSYSATERALNDLNFYGTKPVCKTYASIII